MNASSPLRLPIGIHPGVPEAAYHADPAPEPSASASILRLLHRLSPEHARAQHPRLNPAWEPSDSTDAKNKGTILHSMLLRTPAPYVALPFDDFRTTAAKAAKSETIAAGRIAILSHKLDEIRIMADAISRRIEREFPDLHAALNDPDTLTEATIICRINGVMCRVRVDVLPPPRYGFIGDLKFTGLDAPPEDFAMTLKQNYRFQSNLYPRAVREIRGDEPEFRFYACEETSPFGVTAHTFGPGAQGRNQARVNAALAQWDACLKAQQWPGYPTLLHYVEDEAWEDQRDTDRVMRHSAAAQISTGLVAQLHRISAEIGSPLR